MFTCRGLGYLAGSIVVGKIEHLFNPHLLLMAYFFLLGLSSFLAAVVQSIPLLAILFLVNGIGCSGIDVLSQALTIEVHEEKVDPWMQFLHFCYGVGAFTSPIIMSSMGASAFKMFGVTSLIMGAICMMLSPPRIHKEAQPSINI